MEIWRLRLLYLAVICFIAGYLTELYIFTEARGPLFVLLLSYALSFAVLLYQKNDIRALTAKMAISSLSMVLVGGGIIMLISFGESQLQPWGYHWYYAICSLLGAGIVYLSWEKAKTKEVAEKQEGFLLEAPPQTAQPLTIDWDQLDQNWLLRPDRLRHLRSLRRIYILNEQGCSQAELSTVISQECLRLEQDTRAQEKQQQEGDALTQAARLVEWGVQKIPEIAELNVSDVLMAKTIADIRSLHTSVTRKLVSHHQLLAIHPIDRDTANKKCDERAKAAQEALSILEANEMKLTETIIAAHEELAEFSSVTGFQVVQIPQGYVTFEGNGRREALKRAFPQREIMVEVRLFHFADESVKADIERRVMRVRRWKDVADSL